MLFCLNYYGTFLLVLLLLSNNTVRMRGIVTAFSPLSSSRQYFGYYRRAFSIINQNRSIRTTTIPKTTSNDDQRRILRPIQFHPMLHFRSTLLFSSSISDGSDDAKKQKSKTKRQESSQLMIVSVKKKISSARSLMDQNISSLHPTTKSSLQQQLSDLERESSDPSFWDDTNNSRTKYVQTKMASISKLLQRMDDWEGWIGDCDAGIAILEDESSSSSGKGGDYDEMVTSIVQECNDAVNELLNDSKLFELELLLDGTYDSRPASIVLTAGAGGTEACDWVDMLYRMYTRHCDKMGYAVQIEDKSPGDVVGYKSMQIKIEGDNAYGWLKGEKGAHRLVRLSPFNANNKRQTTFAGVDVMPILENDDVNDVKIVDSDLEISTMRSGGKGGQNVNKVESAVRIKHLPTGVQVKCSQERSQLRNKEIAMTRLKSQLLAIAQEQKCTEISKIRGDAVEAAWGAQIRNYVLQPYKMVKDTRSGWETSDVQGILDGDLEDCIGEGLRIRARQERVAKEEEALG